MKPALLDVNVLISLIDPEHEFHSQAHAWFGRNHLHGWATCPITQNGCLRIMSHPGYPFPGLTPLRVRDILAELTQVEGHLFWPASRSLLDASRFDLAGTTAKNLTGLYLLGIAVTFGGRLATFDRNIRWRQVTGCQPETIETLA